MTPATAPLKNAGVRFPPPLIFVLGMLAGWGLDGVWPLAVVPSGRTAAGSALGWLLIVAGLALLLWAAATFRRHRTAIIPHKPASQVVSAGPYRWSRNPMYVGMTVLTGGVSVLSNILWILLSIPIGMTALYVMVIRREEAYLTSAFPVEYRAYCVRVRRWL